MAGRGALGVAALAALLAGAALAQDGAPEAGEPAGGEGSTTTIITVDARLFTDAPPFARQRRHAGGVLFDVERRWRVGANAFSLRPTVRADAAGRYADLREALWERDVGALSLRAGVHKVFWGVMESNHLIDIVNQTDLVADPDGEEKLGQPMVGAGWRLPGMGRIEVLYLPYFRERLHPRPRARLRADPPVEADGGLFGGGRWHPDYVARWSNSLEAFDVGVYAFRGLSREPDLTLVAKDDGSQAARANYRPITQLGADFQAPQGNMMWKGELLYRRGHGSPFTAFSVGGEYTLALAGADLGLLVEWSRDYRDATAPPTIFAKALFGGMRWRLNNRHDTEVLLGQQIDRSNRMRFVSLEVNHRLGDNWRLQVEGKRFTTRAATPYPLNVLRVENYLQAKLSYFF